LANRQPDTAHLKTRTPNFFMAGWHRAKFRSANGMRTAFAG
ncbi:hypothetical protein PSYPI_47638, partial [Pseudomonas syringae pv. pisi str. 1704B]